ncbi:hypothetical protein [Streptomyces triticiradicis]|uniref:Carboxypeptidase regulatory-like domain-containing protein n=1 Tax=Streptomyces triticiradicis TaxID=2651189 RepID=A0A7J5DG43_9ACTN|nr:hypothetical protein [Streptomyces triticiradicis]KAB1987595.1 hypothetical protein F8144_16110 [Streptomyces triticiradicis]
MRKKSLALTCASVAAGLLLGPVPAAHAAVAPVLYGVGSGDHPGQGLVWVSASSDTAITSITAHLYASGSAADAPEIARVSGFVPDSSTGWANTWRSTTPLRLADLGAYRVVVDLTDADGDTTTTQGTYDYTYELEANLTDLRATPQNPDYGHPDVTVTGGFTVTDPRTGETTPAANTPVDLEISNDPDAATRTGADGRFTYTYHVAKASYDSVNAWLRPDEPWYQSRDNESIEVKAVQSDTRVTLDATELNVTAGQAAKVSGKAEVYVDGAWKPLAGATVDEIWSDESGGVASRPVTGADGRFSGQLTLPSSGTVEVQVRSGTLLKTSGLRTVKVHVARKTSISGFTVSLNKYAQLTASGYLHTGSSIPGDADNHVRLQYSADGKTGWKTMKTVTPGYGDPETGSRFKGTFDAPAKGYYRAYFAGSVNWQAAYGKVLHAERTKTRITGGNASPEPVTKGRTITVRGTLQHYTSSAWRAYSGQKVKILFRPKGSSTWYDEGDTTTRSDGSFGKAFTARQDGTWVSVLLYPNSTHLVSSGYEDYVDVR